MQILTKNCDRKVYFDCGGKNYEYCLIIMEKISQILSKFTGLIETEAEQLLQISNNKKKMLQNKKF